MAVKIQTLKTLKGWYNVIVMIIIVIMLGAAYMNWGKPACYLFFCFAVLAGLMMIVTNAVFKQILPKEKSNKFRNK